MFWFVVVWLAVYFGMCIACGSVLVCGMARSMFWYVVRVVLCCLFAHYNWIMYFVVPILNYGKFL